MIDHNYVEKFTFENIVYIMLGSAVFMGPWMLTNAFWTAVDKMTTTQIVIYNLLIFFGFFLFLLDILMRHSKHPFHWAVVKAFKRAVFVYSTTFLTTMLILLLYQQISFQDPASLFSRKVISGLVACLLAGQSFDLLMHK